jgi:hypothetical protein
MEPMMALSQSVPPSTNRKKRMGWGERGNEHGVRVAERTDGAELVVDDPLSGRLQCALLVAYHAQTKAEIEFKIVFFLQSGEEHIGRGERAFGI